MSFFVLGVNHKECPLEIRERLHFSAKGLRAALERLKQDNRISECVILSTCNRVEIYAASDIAVFPEDALLALIEDTHEISRDVFMPYLYRHQGKEMMHHLFRVACGLDSLVVGENEILGQLREAFRSANETETVHALLYRLMEKALKVGKDVRTRTKINEGAVSIPSVAVELAEKIFGKLGGEKVVVVGTGEMSELTLKNLKNAGANIVSIISRNPERGETLAQEVGAEWRTMDGLTGALEQADIVIASTSAPHPIVTLEHIKKVMTRRKSRPLFLIDIAVPRDIEAEVNELDDVYLYNVDDLKGVAAANLKLREREVREAETLARQAVADYEGWLESLKARPTIEKFESFLDDVLEKELSRFAKEHHLTEAQRKELHDRIRGKLMHPPLEKIKEASQHGGVSRYLEALHSLFNLDNKK